LLSFPKQTLNLNPDGMPYVCLECKCSSGRGMSELSEDYKAKADFYEKKAAQAGAPRERDRLMKIAADYRALAKHHEMKAGNPKPSEQ
jgi:hypothetical protein